jgi:hypothetical protein
MKVTKFTDVMTLALVDPISAVPIVMFYFIFVLPLKTVWFVVKYSFLFITWLTELALRRWKHA